MVVPTDPIKGMTAHGAIPAAMPYGFGETPAG